MSPGPSPKCDLTRLYLNDDILNHTLQILQRHSPHSATHHFVPTFFLNIITQSTTNLHRFYRRQLEISGGPQLTHNYLLIPFNIMPVY